MHATVLMLVGRWSLRAGCAECNNRSHFIVGQIVRENLGISGRSEHDLVVDLLRVATISTTASADYHE
jgi:hypothetical protein